MRRFYKSSKGVTLIELLIVMAIMGIVLMLIYSMNLFGIKTYAKGGSKANVQFEARMTLDHITKEVRYASEVEILPNAGSVPGSISDESCYIYMVNSGTSQEIKYKDKLGEKTLASFTTVTLAFSSITNKVLQYNINGTDKSESFSIYSDVIPLNMPKGNSIVNSSGEAVRYVKGSITVVNTLYLESIDSTANIGTPYNQTLTTSGGTGPYTYALNSGALPPGIVLDNNAGKLNGTPNTVGIYSFTLKVTDSSTSLSAAGYFRVVVKDPSVPDHPPVASDVKIAGTPEPGKPLIGSYNYSDVENDPQDTPIQKWYVGSSPDGTGKIEITGPGIIGGNCIVPLDTAIGSYIFFEVTPIAISGEKQGVPVLSAPIKIVANVPPVISNLSIKVNNVVQSEAREGDVLTVAYVFSDADDDHQGTHIYEWVSLINGVEKTLGTDSSYTVKKEDETNNIFVKMTPVATSGVSPGDTVASSSVYIKSNNGNGKK